MHKLQIQLLTVVFSNDLSDAEEFLSNGDMHSLLEHN